MDSGEQLRSVECADGYRLRYRTWLPAGTPCGTLVLLNGVMSHAGWFQPLACHIAGAGLKLVGADRRGTGLNEDARGDAPSAGALIDDLTRIMDAERTDGVPLHLGGWCWGAVLAVNMAASYEHELASLLLLAPGLYATETVARGMREQEALVRSDASGTACLEIPITEAMFTRGPYRDFISGDGLRCRHVTLRFHGIMKKLAMGATLRLGQLKLPKLLVLASADEATDNARTVQAFQQLPGPAVAIETIDGAHGLQFDAPERLARVIVAWTTGARAS